MKIHRRLIQRLASVIAFAALAAVSNAAVTGQWDFKAGNLAATIGTEILYRDLPTQAGTTFGTTTALGVTNIGGQVTNIMGFPALSDEFGGYNASAGAAPNGGGGNVNQYTVIMDVLFPAASAGKARSLFYTDVNATQTGIFINASDQLAIAGGVSGGNVTPGVWHRLAVTVDTTNTISLFIDGVNVAQQNTPGGLDGNFSVVGSIFLFDDANTNSQKGYLASLQIQDEKLTDGLIAALGAPVASGILIGPPPNPYVVSKAPTSDLRFPARSTVSPRPLLQIVLRDGTATVVTNTIQLKFNNVIVPATITRSAPTTTISYQVTNFLASGSSNFVTLTYLDSAANDLGVQYAFHVGSYVALPAGAAQAPGSANTPGMIFRIAQAYSQTCSNKFLPNNFVRALQQLDGTLLDTNGVPFPNLADLTQAGSQPDGSYFLDLYEGTIGDVLFNWNGPTIGGVPTLPQYNASFLQFPGLPGTEDCTTLTENFADETLAYLQLAAGAYTFGVDVHVGRVDDPPGVDNGYRLYSGPNPRDFFSTLVGQFARTSPQFNPGGNTNEFTFVAPVTGIYPFRLVHWANIQGATLAWYYVDPATGDRVLINDPAYAGANPIPAFRVSTIQREPYVAEVYPTPGGSGFAASAPITVVLSDDNLQVAGNSIKLFLNGTQVALNSSNKVGKLTTIVHNPNANRTTVTNVVQLVYSDNAGSPKTFTNTWSFTIIVGGATIPQVTGQWDFNNCDLTATVGKDLKYFDGPAGASAGLTAYGTCSSFGIPTINGFDATIMKVGVPPDTTSRNNFGYVMDHQIGPNGGGTRVNQYTIIWDMYYAGGTIPFFNCQNTNNAPADGSLFLQGGAMGQGTGGYVMNHGNITVGWHRIAFSVDLSQSLITKWVDGVKAQDWVSGANGLDAARRSWQPTVLLFADGDNDDHDTILYVNSIQVRNGKLSDAAMVALGILRPGQEFLKEISPSQVTGQWDFEYTNLTATVGKDLQYFDGPSGVSSNLTAFGTCSSFGIPTINGVDANVMKVGVPADTASRNNFGYIMDHQIGPNGGGTRVNQYTIIWDMYYTGGTIPFFNCQNTNNAPADGSLFLQGGAMGQGTGGYVMNHGNITAGWHRIAFAADLSKNLITKWVDGVKAQDWVSGANALDAARRSWQPTVLLFADGDNDDHDSIVYVKSIQVSIGKMSDAQMAALGAPNGKPISVALPATSVTGQWDFNFSDLSATVGKDLQYFDGAGGVSSNLTTFGTCTAFGIPMINGVDAQIMKVGVPADTTSRNNFGYIMDHQISANGGGTRVNQYTIIWDMYYAGGTIPFFNCQNTNNAPADGSLFLQGGAMGQGTGGYVMENGNISVGWHRLAFAADLSQNLITKWVDGVKAQDWVSGANSLDTARRSWQPTVLLFADGDNDDHDTVVYVNSIQVSVGKASDAQMQALGGPSAAGIPAAISVPPTPPALSIRNNGNGTITVSWPLAATGWGLQTTSSLTPPPVWTLCTAGIVNNSITLPLGPGAVYFRLHK